MDYKTLTDEQLEQARLDVLAEMERRQQQNVVPSQIELLSKRFLAGGGSMMILQAALEKARR